MSYQGSESKAPSRKSQNIKNAKNVYRALKDNLAKIEWKSEVFLASNFKAS